MTQEEQEQRRRPRAHASWANPAQPYDELVRVSLERGPSMEMGLSAAVHLAGDLVRVMYDVSPAQTRAYLDELLRELDAAERARTAGLN